MDAMLILFGMMKDEGCIRVHASLEIPHDLFWTGPPSKPSDSPDPFCFFFRRIHGTGIGAYVGVVLRL